MKLKYNNLLIKISLIGFVFGFIITLLNLIFFLSLKEQLYLFSLIFTAILSLIILICYILVSKNTYSIDNLGIYFKNKTIIFNDENITKFRLVDENTYCCFINKNDIEIIKIPIKSFSNDEKEKLILILKQFEKTN